MKIGLDARQLANPNTGVGSYVYNLIRELAIIDNKNQYVLFVNSLSGENLSRLNLPANFSFSLVPIFPIDKLQDQFGLVKAMRKLGLDVFHSMHHDVVPLLAGVPVVATVHDIAPMDFYNPSRAHRIFYRFFSQLAFAKARFLICVSVSTGKRVVNYFPSCANKWAPIYLGSDRYFNKCDDFEGANLVANRLGVQSPFILYVGSFARRKNLTNMLLAFTTVQQVMPELHFVIAGRPSGRDDVFPLELPSNVIVTGEISKQELRSLYNQAELLLFATLYEGFGVPIIEAMSCGCPVVTSSATSLPELGGDAAVYASPNHPEIIAKLVLQVLQQGVLREQMIQKGFEQVVKFDWKVMARRTIEVYQKVVMG